MTDSPLHSVYYIIDEPFQFGAIFEEELGDDGHESIDVLKNSLVLHCELPDGPKGGIAECGSRSSEGQVGPGDAEFLQ